MDDSNRGLLERFDGMAGFRNGLSKIAGIESEWAGIPMPIEDAELVIEPTYPRAEALMAINRQDDTPDEIVSADGFRFHNKFWSHHLKRDVSVWSVNGNVDWGLSGSVHHVMELMDTLKVSDVWGIEQESNALRTLGSLLKHRAFKQYLMTGCFIESSKRSGVHYMFRKLRPTIAMSTKRGPLRALAALCLHPIGYYQGTWAGAMCPTDDVIAHLMLMRGDEHMFWRRANQHPIWVSQAGVG